MRHPTGDEKAWSGTPSGVPADLQAAPVFSDRPGRSRRLRWAVWLLLAAGAVALRRRER